jgi:hypothetical protein
MQQSRQLQQGGRPTPRQEDPQKTPPVDDEEADRTANLIAEIEEKCLGRRTEGLRRELGEETWITELWAADRERTRPGFTGRTGQWSLWRYCAQRGEGGRELESRKANEEMK